MTISMINTASTMRRMAASAPDEWDTAVRDLWSPMSGMHSFVPGGVDLAAVHRQNFGFGPEAPAERILDAVDRLEAADAWERIERALSAGLEQLAEATATLTMPDLTVLLLLGDPSSQHFMNELRGLSAFGGISGYIAITVWPTDEILERLEAIALHELHHNVRYSPGGVVWNPQTVAVGEHVVAEGLADHFAVERCGGLGYTHFVSEQTRASDDVLARVAEGLEVTGMQHFSAWVLGDASAELFGGSPVGLPTGAGYAAGARLVGAYLSATGRTAAESVVVPASEILSVGLSELGLTPCRS